MYHQNSGLFTTPHTSLDETDTLALSANQQRFFLKSQFEDGISVNNKSHG